MNSATRRARIKVKSPEEFERWRRLAEKIRKDTTHTTSDITKGAKDERQRGA